MRRRAVTSTPRRRRSARSRLFLSVCFAVVCGFVGRGALGRRAASAALARLDRLDPGGSLRARWARAASVTEPEGTRDSADLSLRCEASLAALLPLEAFPSTLADGVSSARGMARRETLARSRLYSDFARIVAEKGLLRLFDGDAGSTTEATEASVQGSRVSSLFEFDPRTGKAAAVLERLDVPVRAIVVPVPRDSRAASALRSATRTTLAKYFPPRGGDFDHGDSVWFQDPELYHISAFHASHHLDPKPGTVVDRDANYESEFERVKKVAKRACPVDAVVERVVVSRSGVVMALWNVVAGVEPRRFREALREALPNAPEKQIVSDQVLWHTTLARLLRAPKFSGDGGVAAALAAQESLTEKVCGVRVTLPVAWFVSERDKLALALGGEFETREAPFECRET